MPTTTDATIAPTFHLNFDHERVQRFVDQHVPNRDAPHRELAVRLHDAVRDRIRYEVYDADLSRDGTRASAILDRGQGFCVHKSIVYAAALRAVGIPSRLVYGDVRNHLASDRLLELMGGDLFTFHALVSVQLDGQWIRATPVFNKLLCKLYGIQPLEFDGQNDSYYHPHDLAGRRHMEFVQWRGEFDDFPWQTVTDGIAKNHPRLVGAGERTTTGSLLDEADTTR
ncbi:transglutaminase domain-containing protein [Curtobacterium flaccumfaciens]|uniref:transglutaminase-like domain-containing protein n=1 Tax=Curtobacterium flaccumfaciens TaxID=2035 RepID=UPI00188A0144|nr:transglutaminase-like domain-containing protein [Curtobacterium flaccumfaciens]MBF4592362.1 transglutaminase domain-containing protein [Curtobacterium flaccumfaciens]